MPLFHSFSCCLAEELFPWSCLLPSLLHDSQLMCHGRADLCWWRCCKKSSESSISWNLTSILRDSLGLKGVRKCLVWVWPSNKHRSETEITVSLVLYLYCPSHDRVRQLDPKKRFPSFSHPKMAEVTVTGRASATSARAPLCRPRHPSCRAPSRLGPWVRPGITAKKTHQKRMVKKTVQTDRMQHKVKRAMTLMTCDDQKREGLMASMNYSAGWVGRHKHRSRRVEPTIHVSGCSNDTVSNIIQGDTVSSQPCCYAFRISPGIFIDMGFFICFFCL